MALVLLMYFHACRTQQNRRTTCVSKVEGSSEAPCKDQQNDISRRIQAVQSCMGSAGASNFIGSFIHLRIMYVVHCMRGGILGSGWGFWACSAVRRQDGRKGSSSS